MADSAAKMPASRATGADHPPEASEEKARSMGRYARTPWQIPWAGWKRVLRRTVMEMISDRMSMVAAGCAFYATLALFPAITMLISIYGLLFDPANVEHQMSHIQGFLPPSAYSLIFNRIQDLVSKPNATLGIGLLVSTGIALWSSATGTKSILSALNVAYEEKEERSFLRFQFVALAITLLAVLSAIVALLLLVGLPALFAFVGLSAYVKTLIRLASFAILVVFVAGGLALLYRFGPSRRPAQWHWVTPGSVAATLLWLLASALFSFYVGHLASYDVTYGPLGAVVGVMMWFYVTVFVMLLGAELNSELELQTTVDSTEGAPKPAGTRGAYVADHVSAG